MNVELEMAQAAVSQLLNRNHDTAPSLRVPVTRSNRALLRLLRAAELSAWENADAHPDRRLMRTQYSQL
jgi:hypothetical protein